MPAIRTFSFPPELPTSKLERLEQALLALPEKQRRLAAVSPGAAAAHGVRRTEGAFEIQYDLEPGSSALSFITGSRPSRETLLSWARQLCCTFEAAYPVGQAPVLRHGGLCPASVLIGTDDRLSVLDFGVADCFAETLGADDEYRLLHAAANVAPEAWSDPARFGCVSDIFAVGVLLYELATGRHPFGAIRDDPEDCKHQILTEVPVPPKKREPGLDERISEFIYRAVRPHPESRFQTFQEMLAALENCERAVAAGDRREHERRSAVVVGPEASAAETSRAATDPDAAGTDDETQRRLYLEEQARLRQHREESERRQAQRREQIAAVRRELRRHALAVCISLVIVLTGGGALLLWRARSSNREAVTTQLARLNERLNQSLVRAEPEKFAAAVGVASPSRKLVRALQDLPKVAPQATFSVDEPDYVDLRCSKGTAALQIENSNIRFDFELTGSGGQELQVHVAEATMANELIHVVDVLALAQIDLRADNLLKRYSLIFRQSESAAEVEERLPNVLDYVTYRGESKVLEAGPFKPVPGESAVEFELTMVDDHGEEISSIRPIVHIGFECRSGSGPDAGHHSCEGSITAVVPRDEPRDHRRWCMALSVEEVAKAFEQRDSEKLAELTGARGIATSRQTLAWAQECKSAKLVFGPIDVEGAAVAAQITYQPGFLPGSEREFVTAEPIELRFDGGREWRIKSAGTVWPAAPDPLLRQQLGAALLVELQEAWRERDATRYLALFQDAPHTPDDAAKMFAMMGQETAAFEMSALEDDVSETALYIHVRPTGSSAYAAKTFEFDVAGGRLVWNPRSEGPLWIMAGAAYRAFVERLVRADWAALDDLRGAFEREGRTAMAVEEQARIGGWLDATSAAREMFEVLSEEYVGGFPKRVRLKNAPGGEITMQLVTMPGSSPYVLYVQEREVQVGDLAPLWTRRRADRPWEVWTEIVGAAPAQQAVGLTLPEAQELAQELGCEIPLLSEWQRAATTLQGASGMSFEGGVWEWCSDASADSAPQIIGGCWLDRDPDVSAVAPAAHSHDSRAGPTQFGTIGFRLCRRFEVPKEAMREN